MNRVIITGPTGAIGIALINKCIEEKIEVLAICRKGSKRMANIPLSEYVRVVECNLSEIGAYSDNNRFDVFYHFAWDGTLGETRNDLYLQNKNIQYTLDAVQLSKRLGCHTFIGAGSQAEYGRVEGKVDKLTPPFPENGYGIAKLCAGQMSRVLCHQLGMKHVWTRILSVFGPYDGEQTMVFSTIIKLLNGEVPKCTKGEQLWDYLYSGDAANAMYLLGEKGHDGKVYCIGSGKARPLYEYIYIIRDLIDAQSKVELGTIPYDEKQVMFLCADIDDLTKDTEFVPKISFEEGIKNTVRWVRDIIDGV
jgi:nucleoside-diphosphate-sugar epimerase